MQPKGNYVTKSARISSKTAKQQPLGGKTNRQTAIFSLAGDDAVLPFAVESLSARGRAVQLGPALDRLIKRHNYPEPVAATLAEAVVLTALLGSSLKFQGKFILQTQTDGAVNLIVCDYAAPAAPDAPAAIRAYARFDAAKLAQLTTAKALSQADLLGKGSLALTLDQGPHMQLYQGIVALEGTGLGEAAHQYFAQSEQIPTKIRLATALLSTRNAAGDWQAARRGGGVLVQYLPQGSHEARQTADKPGKTGSTEEAGPQSAQDKWRETEILAATIEDAELTDPQLPVEQLLYRLFHQQGVRIFPPQKLEEKCSCSREKLFHILAGFSEEERQMSLEDGKIQVKCEFCSAVYAFSPDEFSKSAATKTK
ncbi:MAG: Hsp33 family molecular chaperone [Candidatus Tokpelaia sp.]|nr:MAG: Hsp33 family molecular chaperone [Candidatus Tokpelaia sp.]KAA6207251.1 MAG: Hsp33 family molecular chaperone [Candidatus Tokpelaia sp.]